MRRSRLALRTAHHPHQFSLGAALFFRRRAAHLLAAGPIGALIGVGLAVVPMPAVQAEVVHHTKAGEVSGALERSEVRALPFPARHAAVYWTGNPDAEITVSFSRDGVNFGAPLRIEHDEVGMQLNNGRTYGTVIPAGDATVARINTDRPLGRVTVLALAEDGTTVEKTPGRPAGSAPIVQPRSAWGADESLRMRGPNLVWPPVFQTVQKLVVHHTAGANGESGEDAKGTIRSIYYYHAVTQGWGDIGYNFVMDAKGIIYKGRSTSTTKTDDGNVTGENPSQQGVTAGHAYGHNSGTEGIAVLGNYVAVPIPTLADTALMDFLFAKANAHGLFTAEITRYTNPINGTQDDFENVPGHVEVPPKDTECPGGDFLKRLKVMRSEIGDLMVADTTSAPDRSAPSSPASLSAKVTKRAVSLSWTPVTTDLGSGGGISGVAGYHVYRVSAEGALSRLGSTTGVTFTDNAATRGVNRYVVQTFDGAANVSPPSPMGSASL